MKIHEFPFVIAYADTDAQGIVYHARYIEIAERARMAIMRIVNDSDGFYVVRELKVRYDRPLHAGDDIIVETRIVGHTGATMDIEHKFVKDGEVYVVVSALAVYVRPDTMKPSRLSKPWLDYIG